MNDSSTSTPRAVVIGCAIIAGAIVLAAYLFAPRYELHIENGIARLDKRSGDVVACVFDNATQAIECR